MKRYVTHLLALGFSTLAPLAGFANGGGSSNQTSTLSPILSQDSLPFSISIEEAPFTLPLGIHSGAFAVHKGKWLLLAGRTNGLHSFGSDPFPPAKQNITAIVVDFPNQTVYTRDLNDPTSGLSQLEIDLLSVTSPQYFQNQNTLYISGGYGVDTATGIFSTKPVLTAIDVPEFIDWVIDPSNAKSAASSIRQTSSPWMQVTGGFMAGLDNHLNGLLIFGQNFLGVYTDSSNGSYTQQVRRFQIVDTGKELFVQSRKSERPNPNYRRRDLNVVPIMKGSKQAFVALSGVFTLDVGVWTVPVEVEADGRTFMADPGDDETFKQGMNNYVSANFTLYSPSSKDNYIVLLGGITYEYWNGTVFIEDAEIPFTNQVTTVKRDKHGIYSQYLMNNQYPAVQWHAQDVYLGAGAFFIEADTAPQYPNQVIDLDKIKKPTVVGYIIGGIMSTAMNTVDQTAETAASPYIFQVVLVPDGFI